VETEGEEGAIVNRALIGAAIGVFVGLLLLAGWGSYHGFAHGLVTSKTPPGLEAALVIAFVCLAYFWWLAVFVGGVVSGLAGLGSWLVRPRREIHDRAVRQRFSRQGPR
jgi:hypothetical protein